MISNSVFMLKNRDRYKNRLILKQIYNTDYINLQFSLLAKIPAFYQTVNLSDILNNKIKLLNHR